jgi:predicted nucleotidyltransferase
LALILDTGPLVALVDRSDPDHERCRERINAAREVRIVPVCALVEREGTIRFGSGLGAAGLATFGAVQPDALIEEIGRRLAEAAPARSRVILFGSRARGGGHERSDVDVLVIEPSVEDPVGESVRLRHTLRGLGVPIDVLVFGAEDARRRSAVRGTVVERALREGRVLVES